MAAGAWTIHHVAKEFAGDGTYDFDTDSFKMGLLASTWTQSATYETWGSLNSLEIASTSTSYVAGGKALTSVTWNRVAGKVTLDAADTSWTATAATLSPKYAVIYDDTTATAGDPVTDGIVCSLDLFTTGGSVSATVGVTLTVQQATSGIFTVT